jgi:hypothetical protein
MADLLCVLWAQPYHDDTVTTCSVLDVHGNISAESVIFPGEVSILGYWTRTVVSGLGNIYSPCTSKPAIAKINRRTVDLLNLQLTTILDVITLHNICAGFGVCESYGKMFHVTLVVLRNVMQAQKHIAPILSGYSGGPITYANTEQFAVHDTVLFQPIDVCVTLTNTQTFANAYQLFQFSPEAEHKFQIGDYYFREYLTVNIYWKLSYPGIFKSVFDRELYYAHTGYDIATVSPTDPIPLSLRIVDKGIVNAWYPEEKYLKASHCRTCKTTRICAEGEDRTCRICGIVPEEGLHEYYIMVPSQEFNMPIPVFYRAETGQSEHLGETTLIIYILDQGGPQFICGFALTDTLDCICTKHKISKTEAKHTCGFPEEE